MMSFASQEIGNIKERGSSRSLIYSIDGDVMRFSLELYGVKRVIKELVIDVQEDEVELSGGKNIYHFEILKGLALTTGSAYKWCFTPLDPLRNDHWLRGCGRPAFYPPLPPVTFALCTTLPAVPVLAGLILSPLDGTITFLNKAFNKKVIAARKFSKLLRGKNTKASRRVFKSLLKQIREL
jgi:hypothetical protein